MPIKVRPTPVPREPRFGRPMIIPVGGGRLVPYSRCTTYVGCLQDQYKVGLWNQRMTAIGLVERKDLQVAVAAHREDREEMDRICAAAKEAALASAAATIGTAMHTFTEQHDRGELDLTNVPEEYRPDVIAYREGTAAFTVLDIERFMVNDDLKVGGTPDRRMAVAGTPYIFDLKTGSIEYSQLTIAMQLAVYSRCLAYDPATGERTPVEVDQNRAIIAHLPAGEGRLDLYWVDIATGWEAVLLAGQVREWRNRKGLTRPMESTEHGDLILDQIAAAQEAYDLRLLWGRNVGHWTDEHTAAAAARKRELLDRI